MNIKIKHRFTGIIILEGDYKSIRDCLDKNRGANLGCADLRGANLGCAKNYRDSHDLFLEAVQREKVSVFTNVEWSAIAQITVHRLCWDSIGKRFSDVIPRIFEVLATAGFTEWLEYWIGEKS